MKSLTIPAVVVVIGMALGEVAPASAMSKTEYGFVMKKIELRYKFAKRQCGRLQGNAKDICMAEAKGKANVALAELAARKHPGKDAHYDVRIARAEAVYAVAREKCDELAGSANATCVKETEAARTSARNEARTKVKKTKTNRPAQKRIHAGQRTNTIGTDGPDHGATIEWHDAAHA